MDDRELSEKFATIRKARATDDGKACVRLAEYVLGPGDFDDKKSSESRQWITLGLKCDAASTPAQLKKLEEKLEKREKGKKGLADMRPKLVAVADSGPS